MSLDVFAHARAPPSSSRYRKMALESRAYLIIYLYPLSLRRRWRLSSAEREGLPRNIPRVLSTKASDTGSRTIRDPSCVTAMRVPGLIPKDVLISAGITNCPLVLTVVICRSILTLYHKKAWI